MFARIEPKLGMGRPTILCEYPIAMAALARAKPGDSRVAERFELYCCGVELANAFGELTDAPSSAHACRPTWTRRSDSTACAGRSIPTSWPRSTNGLPECSGIALGFDRLVMLATGATHIEDVLWLPVR